MGLFHFGTSLFKKAELIYKIHSPTETRGANRGAAGAQQRQEALQELHTHTLQRNTN